MSDLIIKRIKEARQERNATQQELGSFLGKTAASISELERGKVQVNAIDLYQIAQYLNKPIEYFYGEDFQGKDIQNLISIIRKMSPDARAKQLPIISMFLEMQEIGELIKSTDNKQNQIEFGKQFYSLFLQYSMEMNKWMAQLNEIKYQLEQSLGIGKADND